MNNHWLLDWYTINLQLFFLSKQKDKHYISNEKICRFSLISMINTWLFGGVWLLVDENKQYDINLCSPAFWPQSADYLRTIISRRPKITEALILHFLNSKSFFFQRHFFCHPSEKKVCQAERTFFLFMCWGEQKKNVYEWNILFFYFYELRLSFCNTIFDHKGQKCTSTHVLNKVKSFHVRSNYTSIICWQLL